MFSRLVGYGSGYGAGGAGGAGYNGGYGAGGYGGHGGYGAGYRGGYATVAGEDCCSSACGNDGAVGDPAGGMDAGGDCGGCGCGAPSSTVMSYVGPGGDYIPETTYKYVGAGAGTFGLMRIPGIRSNCCLLVVPLLLLLLLIPFLYWMFMPQTTTSTTTMPPVTTVAPPEMTTTQIDCDKGDEDAWTAQKKEYCCDKAGKGCPTTPPPRPDPRPVAPTTTPCPIDCNQGYDDLGPQQWVHGWSAAKKLYCCKVASKGCPSELPPPSGLPPSGEPPKPEDRVYDCDAGYHACMHCLVESWSPKKIDWCCKNRHKGCKGDTPA